MYFDRKWWGIQNLDWTGNFIKNNQFLYAADCLDNSNWDKRALGNMPSDLREKIHVVAIEIACRV